jgi:hypothetical protein
MTTEFNIRKATGQDLPFIYSTWLNSFKHSSNIGKSCRSTIFFEEYRQIIDNILAQSEVRVACHHEVPDVIFGYAVYDPECIHYAFTKESFRKLGIAKKLLEPVMGTITPAKFHTHETFTIKGWPLKTSYNPFVLYNKGEPHGTSQEIS